MENADKTNTAYIQKTTLPYETNYLDLDPQVKDPLGFPVTRITASYKENEKRIAQFSQDMMEKWYREAGATEVSAIATHGVLPDGALQRLRSSGLFHRLVTTDSHPSAVRQQDDFLEVASISDLLLKSLRALP